MRKTKPIRLLVTVGICVGLVLCNLLVVCLPKGYTVFDTSEQGMSEISTRTEELLATIQEDVTIYWLCESGIEDARMRLWLSRYEEAGEHVRVQVVDTALSPDFAAGYTKKELSNGSFIVESGLRSTTVDLEDMYYYQNTFFVEQMGLSDPMTASELATLCEQYRADIQSYYKVNVDDYNTLHSFCGEARLTTAIDFVTRATIPHVYILSGHGGVMPEALTELFSAQTVPISELDLATADALPADAACVILYAPTTDLSEREATHLAAYLQKGGNLLLNTAPDVMQSCPNLAELCASFGLSAPAGKVREGDVNFIGSTLDRIKPTVNPAHNATAALAAAKIAAILPEAHAIETVSPVPAGVTVSSLLTTSALATREQGGVTLGTAGKMSVAVAAVKEVSTLGDGTAVTARLTWFGSAKAFDGSIPENVYYFYLYALNDLYMPFTSSYESLTPAPLTTHMLDNLTLGQAFIMGGVIMLLLPAACIAAGLTVRHIRRRR